MTANHTPTPTTEDVRYAYSVPWHEPENHSGTEAAQEFNRWHAAEIAAAEQRGKAEGFDEACQHVFDTGMLPYDNPYRADQIGEITYE